MKTTPSFVSDSTSLAKRVEMFIYFIGLADLLTNLRIWVPAVSKRLILVEEASDLGRIFARFL